MAQFEDSLLVQAHGAYWIASRTAPPADKVLSFPVGDMTIFPVSFDFMGAFSDEVQELRKKTEDGFVAIGDFELNIQDGYADIVRCYDAVYKTESSAMGEMSDDLCASLKDIHSKSALLNGHIDRKISNGHVLDISDWQGDEKKYGSRDKVSLTIQNSGVSLNIMDGFSGRNLSVELQNDVLRVHGYESADGRDFPVTMNIPKVGDIYVEDEDYRSEPRPSVEDGPG